MQSMYIASRGIQGSVIGSGPRKPKKEKKKLPISHRLYVPCMFYTCAGCFVGTLIFGAGAILVVFGFLTYMGSLHHSPSLHSTAVPTLQPILWNVSFSYISKNNTDGESETFSLLEILKGSLALIGAVVCSIGGFILMVVCVITCETRDKVFELIDHGKMTGLQKNPDFYKLILETQKVKEEEFDSGELRQWSVLVICSI